MISGSAAPVLVSPSRQINCLTAASSHAVSEPVNGRVAEAFRLFNSFPDNRSAEDDDVSEPLFLEQYQQAGESIEVIGHWCLCMVYGSCKAYLEEYIREMERDYRGHGDLRQKLAGKKAKNWFERCRLLFLEELGIDWRKGPVDLAQLEHLNLTRDDVTHNVDVMSILVFQTDRHKEQHPKGLFIDDWACLGLGGRIKVGREELAAALRTVDGFCAWLEGIRLHYPSYIKSLAESQSSEVS